MFMHTLRTYCACKEAPIESENYVSESTNKRLQPCSAGGVILGTRRLRASPGQHQTTGPRQHGLRLRSASATQGYSWKSLLFAIQHFDLPCDDLRGRARRNRKAN